MRWSTTTTIFPAQTGLISSIPMKEVVSQIQNHYSSTDIVALIEKENAKSISLFKKLGFIEECYADSIQSYVFTIYGEID